MGNNPKTIFKLMLNRQAIKNIGMQSVLLNKNLRSKKQIEALE